MMFFGMCAYRLTIFVVKVSLYLCSFMYFEFVVGGGVMGVGWFFGDYCVSPNFFVVLCCGWGWAVTIFKEGTPLYNWLFPSVLPSVASFEMPEFVRPPP